MKRCIIVWVLCLMASVELRAQDDRFVQRFNYLELGLEGVREKFSELSVNESSFRLVVAQGARTLSASVDGNDVGPFAPGKTFVIPLPFKYGFEAYAHGVSVAISPLPDPYQKQGFYISMKTSPEAPSFDGSVHTLEVTVRLAILLIGEYREGAKVGEKLYLIGSDFDFAKRLLDGK